MIVKVMGSENMPDSSPRKSFELFHVKRVQFYRVEDKDKGLIARARLWVFGNPEVGFLDEILTGNAYVLNETGKTISTFAFSP